MPIDRRALVVGTAALAITGGAAAEVIDGAFAATGNDTVTRFFHAAGRLESSGLVMVSGGMTFRFFPPSLISLDAISFYDPGAGTFSDTFHPEGGGAPVTPRLAQARSSHTQTTLLDGRVLITGGRTGASGSNPGTAVDTVELFDPVTGDVLPAAAMSAPCAVHTATRLPDGRVLVAGGSSWQLFDPADSSWGERARPLVRSRSSHAAALLPDGAAKGAPLVLLAGGGGTGPDTLELVDPAAGTSALSSSTLFLGVDDLAAGRLDDGTVLIVGGQDVATGDTVDLAYLYDPATDLLALAAAPPGLASGLADHELVVFDRFALACGGEQQVDGVDCELDYAAVYDRAAGDWVYVSVMTQARDDFTGVLLPGPRVLLVDVAAPLLGQAVPTRTAELFLPVRPADLDGDGVVGASDLVLLLAAWGPCPPADPCPADLDGDGAVGIADLIRMLGAWGPCG